MVATRSSGSDFLLEKIYETSFKKIPSPLKLGFRGFSKSGFGFFLLMKIVERS
jgi:hypothetical protein